MKRQVFVIVLLLIGGCNALLEYNHKLPQRQENISEEVRLLASQLRRCPACKECALCRLEVIERFIQWKQEQEQMDANGSAEVIDRGSE